MQIRAAAYGRGMVAVYTAPVPVIVVGNITVGGSGKTPVVIRLVELLIESGLRPGVISRGYASKAPHYPFAVSASTEVAHSGDEPALIARRTGVPVMIGADRKASIQRLLAESEIDVIVCDDGLQHLALARDFEICVVAATGTSHNRFLLPAGPYRESSKKLSRVDLVMRYTAASAVALPTADNEMLITLVASPPQPVQPGNTRTFDAINGVHAVAAIGNPERFFASCRAHGWTVYQHAFPDHHAFDADDIEFGDALPVIMTEKDAVKCESFASEKHWYLPVDVKLDAELSNRLKKCLAPLFTNVDKPQLVANTPQALGKTDDQTDT